MRFDVDRVRQQFPALALKVGDRPAVFFDGPAGSQVPVSVPEAMRDYLLTMNANGGGRFATSVASDRFLEAAHERVAELLGAADPGEIVFGANMTTLTLALARTLAATWKPGDEIVLSRSEHDANYTPWVQAAEQAGAVVRHIDVRREDCTLDLDTLDAALGERTRLVAVGAASNLSGTVHPVAEIARRVRPTGALLFVDAVHYAPHRLVDVVAWDADFVACSAYKFFGPHIGILWGRRELLETLPVYKLRASPDELPHRFMTGTQNHEGIAGTVAAIDYLAGLAGGLPGREGLVAAYDRFGAYERGLSERLLDGLATIDGVRVHGVTDPARLDERLPTVSITHEGRKAEQIAAALGEQGIFVWHGNFYALPLSETLGLEPDGAVRIGLLHYNTEAEIERLVEALALTTSRSLP